MDGGKYGEGANSLTLQSESWLILSKIDEWEIVKYIIQNYSGN